VGSVVSRVVREQKHRHAAGSKKGRIFSFDVLVGLVGMLCYFFFLVAVGFLVDMICIVELGPKEELKENGIVDDSMMVGHIYEDITTIFHSWYLKLEFSSPW